MPEDVRVELMDGVIYDMGAPYTTHREVALEIIYGVPDFALEVLSPSTRRKDLTIKHRIREQKCSLFLFIYQNFQSRGSNSSIFL